MLEFKNAEEEKKYYLSIKPILLKLVTEKTIDELKEYVSLLFSKFFKYFGESYIDGLNFFSSFSSCIKNLKFNSIKAYLFYFAFQSNRFSSPLIKELINQQLLVAEIKSTQEYVDFCMYCFYKGLYVLNQKNYYMASYLFSTAVSIGVKSRNGNIFLNVFNLQMLRYLSFLQFLTDFDISSCISGDSRRAYLGQRDEKTGDDNIDIYFNFIKDEGKTLDSFKAFTTKQKKEIKEYKLTGLMNAAKEEIIFKQIKENLSVYKKVKLAKIASELGIEFPECLDILKKKVIEGKINIKYDEIEDIIEILELDPGAQKAISDSKEFYKDFINANKNLFILTKDKKNDISDFGNADVAAYMDLDNYY